MPAYQAPRSDEDRLSFLEKARATGTADRAVTRNSITQETLDALTAFVALFRPLFEALARTLAGRVKEVREREAARAVLDTYVRDFWEVLKRRAHRLGHGAEVLTFYGLPADGTAPHPSTFDELIQAAEAIGKGETAAIAAGFPPMSNPSAAEVAAVLATARTQAADVPTADRNYVDAQQAVAAQRPRADELITDIVADLRSSLRRLDPPTQRRIMRNYGATFTPLPGEPEDPTDPAPLPATPPTPSPNA